MFHCTVSELLHRITCSELTEWQALYRLEPWGDVRDDWRMGQICATMANLKRSRHTRPMNPDDFRPRFRTHQQSVYEQIATFKALTDG